MASYYGLDPELTQMLMQNNIFGQATQAMRNRNNFVPAPIRPFLDPTATYLGALNEPRADNMTAQNVPQGALAQLVRPNIVPQPRSAPPQMTMPNPADFQPWVYPRNVPQPPPGMGPDIATAPTTGVEASAINNDLQQGQIPEQKPMPQVIPQESPQQFQPPQKNIKQGTDAGFGEGAPADPISQMGNAQQEQQQGSDAWKWGLLAAGLGILANNKGNYGAAGPAIGAGGLQGVQTYLGVRQQEQNNAFREQQQKQNKEYQDRQLGMQEDRIGMEKQKFQAEENRRIATSLAAMKVAGDDPQLQEIAAQMPEEFLKSRIDALKPGEFTSLMNEMGIKPGTPEYQQYAQNYLDKKTKGTPLVSVSQNPMIKTTEDFNEKSASKQAESLIAQFDTLKTVPDSLMTLDRALQAASQAKGFTGSFAEQKLAIAKFFNNNLGTEINPEAVASAEELRSALFRQIMDNLKKMDSQPTQKQQDALREALGGLTTDPSALPRIIGLTREIFTTRVKEHNKRVKQSQERGAIYLYDIDIPLPENAPISAPTQSGPKDPWE